MNDEMRGEIDVMYRCLGVGAVEVFKFTEKDGDYCFQNLNQREIGIFATKLNDKSEVEIWGLLEPEPVDFARSLVYADIEVGKSTYEDYADAIGSEGWRLLWTFTDEELRQDLKRQICLCMPRNDESGLTSPLIRCFDMKTHESLAIFLNLAKGNATIREWAAVLQLTEIHHTDPFDSYLIIEDVATRNRRVVFDHRGKNDSPKEGCYIATCIYGDYDCPQVWMLRRVRDQLLRPNPLGRCLISVYYAISPQLVRWFGKADWFRVLAKGALDKLVIWSKQHGFQDTPYRDEK